MNKVSVKKARSVLNKIANVRERIRERERARDALAERIRELQNKPSKKSMGEFKESINALIEKEKNLARTQSQDSERIKSLKGQVSKLKSEHNMYEDQISALQEQILTKPKVKLKAGSIKISREVHEDRKKHLEKKVKNKIILSKEDKKKLIEEKLDVLTEKANLIKDGRTRAAVKRKITKMKKKL